MYAERIARPPLGDRLGLRSLGAAYTSDMHFGPFFLDERTWSLNINGSTVDLSPRLVKILAYLVARKGVTVTKNELLEQFWPDVFVEENVLTRAIADIRKAVGDDASEP